MTILYVLLALAAGIAIGWLVEHSRMKSLFVQQQARLQSAQDILQAQLNMTTAQRDSMSHA